MFSKSCEYGLKATIYIAEQSILGNMIDLKEIAEATNSPVSFTAKILQILTRNHIITSIKGPYGGFFMDENQLSNIYLKDIVAAIDGDNIYRGCGLGLAQCNENKPCPLHFHFKSIRDDLRQMLASTSVQDLAIGLKSGLTFLKR
jgi:Rrf2 family transcriptional regulator, iron-sulfur cluster assembly transcription factor